MAFKTVEVEIEGISPLLMHRYPMEPIEAIEKKTPEEQAEIAAYRHPTTEELCVPGECVRSMFVAGGLYVKGKGRASLQKTVAACVMIDPAYLSLNQKDYRIDSRAVRMPATGGTVVRHRPIFDEWKLAFELTYDDALISALQAREVVDSACARVGLLDFRPAKKGPMGRSKVVKWSRNGTS